MSDIQSIMKFELLPNEILIDCFEYLHAIDIFNAFDLLNSRFYHFIRNIPLHFNGVDTNLRTFGEFYTKIGSNTQIKHQVKSLKMSTMFELNASRFLLRFNFHIQFSELQSLTLISPNERMVRLVTSILEYLTNLRYVRLDSSSNTPTELLSELSTLDIHTLLVPTIEGNLTPFYPFKLPVNSKPMYPFKSLVNLTISSYFGGELHALFSGLPKIRYLNIKMINRNARYSTNNISPVDANAIYLKRLIIDSFNNKFKLLEILLRLTPNLKLLIIFANNNKHIVDAPRWQQLITTSLPQLDVFKFKFGFKVNYEDTNIIEKYREFQTDFWHQQHCWHIECIFDKSKVLFYTVPYSLNEFEILPYSRRLFNKSFNNVNTYANVTDLKVCPEGIIENSGYYFSNVKLLNLHQCPSNNDSFLRIEHVACLKTSVNLNGVTHLNVSLKYEFRSSLALLLLLKEASRVLSSLKIQKDILFSLLGDYESYVCSGKTITELIVTGEPTTYASLNFAEMVKVCKVFLNMEKLCCEAREPSHLEMILEQLSKLSHMKIFSYPTPYSKTGEGPFKFPTQKLTSYSFSINCDDTRFDDEFDNDEDFDAPYDIFG